MLKKLNQFQKFDAEEFFRDKRFKVIAIQDWKDYNTKEDLGLKVEVVIVADKTNYECKEGEAVTNVYEKLVFKIADRIDVPIGSEVKPINPVCKIYGEYRNLLSVVCSGLDIVGK